MKKLVSKIGLFALTLAVGVQVALPAKAFYSTSSVITDGQAITSQGRSFITDILIPYVLPLVLALSVVAFVWYRIKSIGKLK